MEAELFSATTPVFRVAGRSVRRCRAHGYPGKRAFDLLLAACLAPLLLPLALGIWALVRADGGPGLARAARVGRAGTEFVRLRFRTAPWRDDGAPGPGPRTGPPRAAGASVPPGPRHTPLGAVLRRTGLDNLPQVWNVILGEMSFVGPSPVARPDLARYGMARAIYLGARPGMTGLWQVSRREGEGFAGRVHLDLSYSCDASVAGDLGILVRTAGVLLDRCGVVSARARGGGAPSG